MQGVRRLEAFSDGVFAIAITLLVLEIKVPARDADFLPALGALWPSFAAYFVSFIYVGLWWIATHSVTAMFARVDGSLLLLYLIFLMTIAFVPFPTAALADRLESGHQTGLAAAFYGATMLLPTLGGNGMLFYLKFHPRVVGRPELLRAWFGWNAFISIPIYAAAMVVSLVATPIGLVMYALAPAFYALTYVSGRIPLSDE